MNTAEQSVLETELTLQNVSVSFPIYQGGSEYAAVRQARQLQQQTQRQVDDARRTAVQNAVQAWETLTSARAAAESTRAAIRANEIALEGVEREAIVGSRTTLDVLNAQQQLLTLQFWAMTQHRMEQRSCQSATCPGGVAEMRRQRRTPLVASPKPGT